MPEHSDFLRKFLEEQEIQRQERMNRLREIQQSEEYQNEMRRLYRQRDDFLFALTLCWWHGVRIPEFADQSFFMRSIDDLIESVVLLVNAIENGARNPARRELRYILEVSVKALFVDQYMPRATFDDRVAFFDRRVGNSGVVPEVSNITLGLVPEETASQIVAEIKKAYGRTSQFVHPSVLQVRERVQLANEGISLGFDGPDTIRSVNDEVFDVCSLVLNLLFHCLGHTTTGDIFEGGLTYNESWSYHWHPHIAIIDERYDYKAERASRLECLQRLRAVRLEKGCS